MDEITTELADIIDQPADLMDITNDSRDVDHAKVMEELNSFTRNNPDVDNFASEQLQHGLGECYWLRLIFFVVCSPV